MKHVLFLVNGVGLGNATRCHAIMQKLDEAGVGCSVATSGNGLWYFRQQQGVGEPVELNALHYGTADGRLSMVRTLLSAPAYVAAIRGNGHIIETAMDRLQPDALVTDSTYLHRRGRTRQVPLLAVNNADVVHALYWRYTDRPQSIRLQFHGVEELDFFYHRMVPDVSLSPRLDTTAEVPPAPYFPIGPIVRRACRPSLINGRPKRILIMLSGSRFGSLVNLTRAPTNCGVDIVGRAAPHGPVPEGCRYLGRVLNTPELAAEADLLVVNGGFSAISEAFVMRKPLIVIPVPNHAEQWVNARTICELGVGMMAREEDLEDALTQALARIESFRAAYARLPTAPDGAQQAAGRILESLAAASAKRAARTRASARSAGICSLAR
jgi:UDP:flavonoid glycosyltransferase YjiC (YdhE family)